METSRLEFGNPDQIKTVKVQDIPAREQEKIREMQQSGELKPFIVTVDFELSTEVKVWAKTQKEAEEEAEEIADPDMDDIEIAACSAREIALKSIDGPLFEGKVV